MNAAQAGQGKMADTINVPRSTSIEPAVGPVAAPIKKAQDFIKKVGRPKIYPDRKTQMRELMRRKRAK